jgi:hypothetical protein
VCFVASSRSLEATAFSIRGGNLMTAAQFEKLDEGQAESILRWRFRVLSQAGYEASAAVRLAAEVQVDLHEACDLVTNGCPPETAARILL